MKTLSKKSLKLSRETVRNLQADELGRVAGGREVTETCPGCCIEPTEDCNLTNTQFKKPVIRF